MFLKKKGIYLRKYMSRLLNAQIIAKKQSYFCLEKKNFAPTTSFT